jgi:hypothetical protein
LPQDLIEWIHVCWVKVNALKNFAKPDPYPSKTTTPHEPDYSLPLLEIDVAFNGSITKPAVLDPGSQIIVIRKDLVQEVNVHVNPSQ